MTDENTNQKPTPEGEVAAPNQTLGDNDDIDKEVAELLTDMIALLCNAHVEEVKIEPVRGDKNCMFVVDFNSPTKGRYRGMVIGREGRTIMALRQYLKAVGGAYRRYYDIDLVEDRSRRRTPRNTPRP